jgi:hypothetical protein
MASATAESVTEMRLIRSPLVLISRDLPTSTRKGAEPGASDCGPLEGGGRVCSGVPVGGGVVCCPKADTVRQAANSIIKTAVD